MNTQIASKYRHRLLATVSSMALLGSIQVAVAGNDAERPLLWIELGGQLEQIHGFGDPLPIPFAAQDVSDGFKSPVELQRLLSDSITEEGSISFQPEDSDWTFSASLRYGRAQGSRKTHQQTPNPPLQLFISTYPVPTLLTPQLARYSETNVHNSEKHMVLDFQAGKDVGLGIFGSGSESTFKVGVRFAQFSSHRGLEVRADPDYYFPTKFLKYYHFHHIYHVTSQIDRSFKGVGPSLSWDASVPLAGNLDAGEINVDWGVNAALLFGKQKIRGHHKLTGMYYKSKLRKYYLVTPVTPRSGNPDRSRNVTVPNVGGFAGLSLRYSNAKVSLGYRADLFFGAMDGGIDTAKKTTLGFNGPYASISFGLGN